MDKMIFPHTKTEDFYIEVLNIVKAINPEGKKKGKRFARLK